MTSIQQEKLQQAVEILNQMGIDAWMTFVRETSHNADPALPLILGFDVTWQSAFIVTRDGHKVAIVGRYDVENVERMGGYDRVIGYDQGIQDALVQTLDQLQPHHIAVNYSESDSAADGLSHGMYLRLVEMLKSTPYQLISAEGILSTLRGRKSNTEIERIKAAIALTEQIVDGITAMLRPSLSEVDIAQYIHAEFKRHGVRPAWEPEYCPIVNCGPDSTLGHGGPSAKNVIQAGQLVHIDLGVVLDDYVSDIQRVWYLQPSNEATIPEPVLHGFEVVNNAISAAADVLKVGAIGWHVDQAARDVYTAAGYTEYQHATGHQVGRTVHDGGSLLGPRWDRYGNSPDITVEANNIFTLELGVEVPGYGAVSLEEDVLITEHGLEWLSQRQTAPIVVKV